MRVINISQRSEEWFPWRKNGITASSVAIILNRNPDKTRWRLWAEIVGKVEPDDLSRNPYVQRGIAFEDEARQLFENLHGGEMLLPVCVESTENSIMRASLDGLMSTHEPAELKYLAFSTIDDAIKNGVESKAYKLYWPQVQQQIFVTGASRGYLFMYSDTNKEVQNKKLQKQGVLYKDFVIERDENFIRNEMLPACLDFFNLVKSRKEPAKDPLRDIFVPEGDAIEKWDQLSQNCLSILDQIAEAKERIEELEKQNEPNKQAFFEIMGDFMHAEAAGMKVTRFKTAGKIDYEALIAKHFPELPQTELETFRKPSRSSVRLTKLEAAAESAVTTRAEKAKKVQRIKMSKEALNKVDQKYAW